MMVDIPIGAESSAALILSWILRLPTPGRPGVDVLWEAMDPAGYAQAV